MNRVILLLFVSLSPFFYSNIFSQVVKVDFNIKVAQSSHIVEGRVIQKASYWDQNHYNIYTVNTIKVYKIFKGSLNASTIEIITPGGTIGMTKEVVHPSLGLNTDDLGLFMLKNSTVDLTSTNAYQQFEPYASIQGFVKYNESSLTAASPFEIYNDIEQGLYTKIQTLTGQNYTIVQTNKPASITPQKSIASFSPTTVTAGTKTLLTITGTNFGATPGTVRFSNANDGGATFVDGLPTEIISWSNTSIVVEVFNDAGTGPIQVVGTGTFTSAQTLTVTHAEINVEFDPGTGNEAYQTQHVNDNGSGGYTWQMHTDFDVSAANAPFIRALDTWRCNTGINWIIGATSTVDVIANDGANIVRFDNGGELAAGVLGVCTSRFTGCINGGVISWYVSELDIVFDDATNWNFTTAAPSAVEVDFESVAVHELGHGHQLGHVISVGTDIMHFSISSGIQIRTPSANNLTGGNNVQSRSTGAAVCGQAVMTNHPCAAALLPIEFNAFDALRQTSDQVKLTWSTLSEDNNKGFFVERMLEHETTFSPIAWVEPAGNSVEANDYQYIDNNSYSGVSYYRLKQVDYQSSATYSTVRAVSGDNDIKHTEILVFPKAVDHQLNIRFAELTEGTTSATIQIFNSNGQLVAQFDAGIQAYEVLELQGVQQLGAGMYFLAIAFDNGETDVQKFIKK